jgi:hypothetical protein
MVSGPAHLEFVKKFSSNSCDASHRPIERPLVRFRGLVVAADFPNELKRGIVELLLARLPIGHPKLLDVSAHEKTAY